MDEGDVRLEAGDVLAAVLALLLLLGVRLALVVAHLEEVLEGFAAHRAVEFPTYLPVSQQSLPNIDSMQETPGGWFAIPLLLAPTTNDVDAIGIRVCIGKDAIQIQC